MNEDETFIARWSRKKREAESDAATAPRAPAQSPQEKPAAPEAADQAAGASSEPQAKRGQPDDSPVDLASLPPLESIAAGTDIRAFLQSGVPADLARAALRRAWAADPAIRDFIEIAENQWDFANPTALPGFGPLAAGDDVRQLVAQALGRLGHETDAASQSEKAGVAVSAPDQSRAPTQPIAAGAAPKTPAQADEAALAPTQVAEAAATAPEQPEGPSAETERRPNRRSHGGALPR
jgi:hypothetical protein